MDRLVAFTMPVSNSMKLIDFLLKLIINQPLQQQVAGHVLINQHEQVLI